MPTKLSLML